MTIDVDDDQNVASSKIRLLAGQNSFFGNQRGQAPRARKAPLTLAVAAADSASATRPYLAGMERVITASTRSGYHSRNIHGGQFWVQSRRADDCWLVSLL